MGGSANSLQQQLDPAQKTPPDAIKSQSSIKQWANKMRKGRGAQGILYIGLLRLTEGDGSSQREENVPAANQQPPPYESTQVKPPATLSDSMAVNAAAAAAGGISTVQGRGTFAIVRKPVFESQGKKSKSPKNEVEKYDKSQLLDENRALKEHLENCERLQAMETSRAEDLHIKNNSLLQTQRTLQEELRSVRDINTAAQLHIETLLSQQEKLEAKIENIQKDNDALRIVIFKNESDLTAHRSEEYYIQGFEGLEADLERWIAGYTKANVSQGVSEANENGILESLESIGARGRASSAFLRTNQSIRIWFQDIPSRIPLIRHFVSIFLFDRIFDPFVVGLSPELTEALLWMDVDLISQGFIPRRIAN